MAKMQFLPALLTATMTGFAIVAVIVVFTLLFGRVYCSFICPLGIMQDLIGFCGRISSRWRKQTPKKKYYTFSPAKTELRMILLGVFILLLLTGLVPYAALIAPYSTYGRIAANIFAPVYLSVNNVLAWFADRADSYMFYPAEIWIRSIPTFAIAAASFIIISILSWRNSRTYCNTVCPVGTVLGYVSKLSLLKYRINESACKNCQQCVRNCKASCIDLKNHEIDYSRCVVCGDCLSSCKFGALTYSFKGSNKTKGEKSTDTGRRAFLVGAAIATTATAMAQEKKKLDGGLAVIKDRVAPERKQPITPPGSLSAENMAKHCTGCQLCVQACPNGVLTPSTDFTRLMQPELSYANGHCRIECHRCSDVCPTGAIKPITAEQKTSLKVGQAVWVKKNCVVITDEVSCGNCARHCPAGAIEMTPMNPDDEDSPKIPVIDQQYCIGCGACEDLCPARPFSAIVVNGINVQHEI